jgi:hypothetical protein
MNIAQPFLRPLAALSLIAVGLSGVAPATAETIELQPESTLDWNEGQADQVAFDPSSERLWVWNRAHNPSLPYGNQVNVLAKNSDGDLQYSFRWKYRSFSPSDISFASNGTMYATDDCKVAVVTFKANGRVKKTKLVKFKRGVCPLVSTPIDGNKIILADDEKIREYRLPLTSRSRAIRTITYSEEYDVRAEIVVASDGSVFVSHYSASDGVDFYSPSQSGTVDPNRSFTIHPDYGRWYITDMSLGYSGNIYLRVNGDILVYQTTASGINQVPVVEYDLGEDVFQGGRGLAWDGYSRFVTVDYGQNPSLRFYFMAP